MQPMLGPHDQPSIDEQQLSADVVAVITQLRQCIERKDSELQRKDREIAWRDARLEKINFELAPLGRGHQHDPRRRGCACAARSRRLRARRARSCGS